MSPTGPLGPQGAVAPPPPPPPSTGPVGPFGAAGSNGTVALPEHLDKVLQAAPTLRTQPDLALAAVNAGGDIMENARHIAALHMVNSIGGNFDQVAGANLENALSSQYYKAIRQQQFDASPTFGQSSNDIRANIDKYSRRLVPRNLATPLLAGTAIGQFSDQVDQAEQNQAQQKKQKDDARWNEMAAAGATSILYNDKTYNQSFSPIISEPTPEHVYDMYINQQTEIIGPVLRSLYPHGLPPDSALSQEQIAALHQTEKQFGPYLQAAQREAAQGGSELVDPFHFAMDCLKGISKAYHELDAKVSQQVANVQPLVDPVSAAEGSYGQTTIGLRVQPYPKAGDFNPTADLATIADPFGITGLSTLSDIAFNNSQNQFKLIAKAIENHDYASATEMVGVFVLGALAAKYGGKIVANMAKSSAVRALLRDTEQTVFNEAEQTVTREGKFAANKEMTEPVTKPAPNVAPTSRSTLHPKYHAGQVDIANEIASQNSIVESLGQNVRPQTFSVDLIRDTATAVTDSMKAMWSSVDQAVWRGTRKGFLHDKMLDEAAVHEEMMTDLDRRLNQLRKDNVISTAKFNNLSHAARAVLDHKFSSFYDDYLARSTSGVALAARMGRSAVAGTIGQAARPMGAILKTTIKVLKSKEFLGGSISSGALNPLLFKNYWEEANGPGSKSESIGQTLFGKDTLGSGMVDAFVAFYEPAAALGTLKRAGEASAVAGTAFTEKSVQAAWLTPRYQAALRMLTGKTAADMIALYPFLSRSAGDGVTIASLLCDKPIAQLRTELRAAEARVRAANGTERDLELAREKVLNSSRGMSAEKIHQKFVDLAAAAEYRSIIKLPQSGLLGAIRLAKLSDNRALSYVAHLIAQAPMTQTEAGEISARSIAYGDVRGIPALDAMMRQGGEKSSTIRGTINMLLLDPNNHRMWQEVWTGALSNMMTAKADRGFLKVVGEVNGLSIKTILGLLDKDRKDLQNIIDGRVDATEADKVDIKNWIGRWEGILGTHEKDIRKVYAEIDDLARKLAGDQGAGETGKYGIARSEMYQTSSDLSRLTNDRFAALSFSQRAALMIPPASVINRTMLDIVEQIVKSTDIKSLQAQEYISRKFLKGTDWINVHLNEQIFKPAALATGGWATRVSISEIALNTARLGPQDIVAGYAGQNLITQERKIQRLIDRGLSASEAADRVGFGTYGPSKIADKNIEAYLKSEGYTAPRIVYRYIAAFARGIMDGADESILRSVGRQDFLNAAIKLSFYHDSYLSPAANAIHTKPLGSIDFGGEQTSLAPGKTASGRQRKLFNKNKQKIRNVAVGDTWHGVNYNDTGFYDAWYHMSNAIASDNIYGRRVAETIRDLYTHGNMSDAEIRAAAIDSAESILHSIPEEVRATMDRNFAPSVNHPELDPIRSWAQDEVDNILTLVHGQGPIADARFHANLLDDMADGTMPRNLGRFLEQYGTNEGAAWGINDVPHQLYGRERLWDTGLVGHKIQRIAAGAHEKVLGPIVNHWARQPVFIAEFANARKLINPKVLDGTLTSDQADMLAQIQASDSMIRFIHNPDDKLKFEQMLSVYSPFYFAQNQAWRRMGRLFASDPGAFYQYVRMMLGTTDYVAKVTQNTGFSAWTIPLSATMMMGLPLTMSLSSMTTTDPLAEPDANNPSQSTLETYINLMLPKPGWVPQIVGHLVLLTNPWKPFGAMREKDWADSWLGQISANQSLFDLMIPNSIARNFKNLAEGVMGDELTKGQLMDRAYIQTLNSSQNVVIHNLAVKTLKKVQAEAKVQGWDNNTTEHFYAIEMEKAIGANNPQAQRDLRNQIQMMSITALGVRLVLGAISPFSIGLGNTNPAITKLKQTHLKEAKGDLFVALDKMWQEDPTSLNELLPLTKSKYGGYIPETKPTFDFVRSHMSYFPKYGLGIWAYGPNLSKDNTYFSPAGQALIDAGLRELQTPEDALKAFNVAVGNSDYYNNVLTEFPGKGLSSIRSQYRDSILKANPDWKEATTNSKRAYRDVNIPEQLRQLGQLPEFKNLPVTKHIKWFMDTQYSQLVLMRGLIGKSNSPYNYDTVKQIWEKTIIPSAIAQYPDLKPAALSVFMNL